MEKPPQQMGSLEKDETKTAINDLEKSIEELECMVSQLKDASFYKGSNYSISTPRRILSDIQRKMESLKNLLMIVK